MLTRIRADLQRWLIEKQDVIQFAIIIALTLYVIAFSVENKLARRVLYQRITTLEQKCGK